MTDDTTTETDEQAENVAALRERGDEHAEDGSALAAALDRRVEEGEQELDEYRELTELKLTLAEAEEAGLSDDPAVERLREQIEGMEQALGITDPEEEAEQQVAALENARDGARQQGNDELVERYDETIAEAKTEAEITTSEDEKISALSAADSRAERAQARLKHAKGKMSEEALDELHTQETGLALMTAMVDADDTDTEKCQWARRTTHEKTADMCEDVGVPVPELRYDA